MGARGLIVEARRVLVATALGLCLVGYAAARAKATPVGTWRPTGSLPVAAYNETVTPLANGKVLVAGGANGTSVIANAEIYDPASGSWTSVAPMPVPRHEATATLLRSGKVLVAGGTDGSTVQNTAEIYNPATNSWSMGPNLGTARRYHSAALLPSGRVLLIGGFGIANYTATSEIYDPVTNTVSPAADMNDARYLFPATSLADGRVLVSGGSNSTGYLARAEVYNETTNTWSLTGAMGDARNGHVSALLPSGQVLVTGGQYNANPLADAEVYSPASNSWQQITGMAAARIYPAIAVLPGGRVLLAGGINDWGDTSSAEIFDPGTGSWHFTGYMGFAREGAVAVTLASRGQVLVVGGSGSSDGLSTAPLSSSELYTFASAPDPPTHVQATAGPLSATVKFEAPLDNGASPITSFTVSASPGGARFTLAPGASSGVLRGLRAGKRYRFTVTATNAYGTSGASSASNTVKPLPVCRVPRLAGLTRVRARRVLSGAHCALGRVTQPRGLSGRLVVVGQSLQAGAVRPAGSKVSFRLGRPHRGHRHG